MTTSVRDYLQAIYDERGSLKPAFVVDAARPESSPLHKRFEWDDTVAGEAYRRVQAQQLIRSVNVVYTPKEGGDEVKMRAFLPVREGPDGPAEYTPAAVAMSDPLKRKMVLNEYRRSLESIKDRYQHLPEYADYIETYLLPEGVES